jgi:hypothetical protein
MGTLGLFRLSVCLINLLSARPLKSLFIKHLKILQEIADISSILFGADESFEFSEHSELTGKYR